MQRRINTEAVKLALTTRGWDQRRLSKEVGVSAQAITNWFKGADFPRPDKLLSLSTLLSMSFSNLVITPSMEQPVIAFRKKAGTKTTQVHLQRALSIGYLLRPLTPYLPPLKSLRTFIPTPSIGYEQLQNTSSNLRHKLGIVKGAVISYRQLINQFSENDAVIIPVMWGIKNTHENALHILLKSEKVTFIFLNLDTYIEDFKFWMAHELAHVFTPELAGTNDGEDFADAFAGALLFPGELAKEAYDLASNQTNSSGQLRVLQDYAWQHEISLHSVYLQICQYVKSLNLPELKLTSQSIHPVRSMNRGKLVSHILFNSMPPDPESYIASVKNTFESPFFDALKKMIIEKNTGQGYIQQILDSSISDATALHNELKR